MFNVLRATTAPLALALVMVMSALAVIYVRRVPTVPLPAQQEPTSQTNISMTRLTAPPANRVTTVLIQLAKATLPTLVRLATTAQLVV
jgi:hypothetical protein